ASWPPSSDPIAHGEPTSVSLATRALLRPLRLTRPIGWIGGRYTMSKPIAATAGSRLAAVAKVPDWAGVGGIAGLAGRAGAADTVGAPDGAGLVKLPEPGPPGPVGVPGPPGTAGRPGIAGRPGRASTAPSERGNSSYQALNSARSRSTQIVRGS